MANIVYMARSAWTGLLDTIRSKAGITGSMTVSQAASAVDSIETGGGGLEYETGIWTPTTSTNRGYISFENNHTSAPAAIFLVKVDDTHTSPNNNIIYYFSYLDLYKLWGGGISLKDNSSTSVLAYGLVVIGRGQTFDIVYLDNPISHNSDDPGDADNTYSRYYATESGFHPAYDGVNTNIKFNTYTTYKWIAIWGV